LIQDIKETGYHERMNDDVFMINDDDRNNEENDDQDLEQEIQEIDGNESVSDQDDDDEAIESDCDAI
jgi:hypothetical protein